ncbi:hypothetical protein SESBI_35378 [Sesbania bispinosa]|nr:hypothetical protein SESBI_35378 [Sesbania bispinosa]
MGFTVVVHHGGSFVGDRMVRYEGGEVHAFHNLDIDNWSYFEALGLIKELGYREAIKLWWKGGKGRKGKNFRSITWDTYALEMGSYVVENNCEVDMYVEHTQISEPVLLEDSSLLPYDQEGEKEKVVSSNGDGVFGEGDQKIDEGEVEQGEGGNNSEDACNGDGVDDGIDSEDGSDDFHFSNSEEERNLGLDDGFEDAVHEENLVNEMTENVVKERAEKLTPKRGKRKMFEGQCSGVRSIDVEPERKDKGKQPMESNQRTRKVKGKKGDEGTAVDAAHKQKGKSKAQNQKIAPQAHKSASQAQTAPAQGQKSAPQAQKGKAQAQKCASQAQKGKAKAQKSKTQAQQGKAQAQKAAPKAQQTAPQNPNASSSQAKKPRLASKVRDYAKNLTVAQLLACMMAANNTWAEVVRSQTTESEVTMKEPDAVMPTHHSKVGEQNEDGSANPQEEN